MLYNIIYIYMLFICYIYIYILHTCIDIHAFSCQSSESLWCPGSDVTDFSEYRGTEQPEGVYFGMHFEGASWHKIMLNLFIGTW